MRKRSLLLLTGAFVLVASLVVGPSATAKPERASAGTVVIIHDQEPGILNPFLSEGNGYTVSLALNKILAAGTIYNDKVQVVPELLTAGPKILKKEPLKVTATYKPNAVWSDGKQITGADFVATYRTIMNPNWDITAREGWEDIAKIRPRARRSRSPSSRRGRSATGRASRATVSFLHTRSRARTSTSSGLTRSTSRAAPSSSRAGRRARSSRS